MASLGFSPGMPGSVHQDVLSANPTTTQDKLNLIEELKRRGRAAVASKNYPDADLLYGKGIEVLETLVSSDNEVESTQAKKDIAILYSNRSLSLLSLGQSESARSDAQKATEYDATYIKGYWRLGQALMSLSRHEEALRAYEAAYKLDGKNKALKKECEKVRVKLEQDRLLMESGAVTTEETVKTSTPAPAPPVKKTVTTTNTTTTKNESKPAKKNDGDEDGEFTKSDHVRGYKIVGGKKTSYFHHEQTEEEKKLIGSIAPKKLDAAPTKQEQQVPEDRSAWNKAGTWEERDVTKWATDTLTASLLSAEYILPPGSPDPNAHAIISKVQKMDGHASYATVRGKKRYIYEFAFSLHWVLNLSNGDVCTGQMTFPDVDTTCDVGDGYEMIKWEVEGGAPSDAVHLINRFVKDGGLRDVIHEKIDGWVGLFKATY